MEKLLDKMGLWGILALVALIVVAYSLWGAAVLRSQHVGGTFTDTVHSALTIL